MYSKIIKNGTIIDGSGRPPFRGDVAIEDDKIVQIADLSKARAVEVIDAEGKFVVPGFVDIQNHSDVYWTIFDNPGLDSLVAQGVTTAIIGNCGASLAPLLSRDALLSIQKWHNLEGINFNWLSFDEYIKELGRHSFGVNIASLVGYSTLRRGLVKDDIRSLRPDEMKALKKALKESIEAGAFGLSSGLSYAHESIISESELVELGKIVKDAGALMSIHLRSEGAEITESVAEALELINKLNVNLKISHFKVRGRENWHLLPHAIALIEDSYQKRGQVLFDLYPYDFIWQVLYTYIPKWAYEGGREAMLHHLKDPAQRKKIIAYLNSKDINYEKIFIASTTMPLNVVGKSLGEIGQRQGTTAEEALLTILENGGSEILVFDQNLDQTQVNQLLAHPLSIIATDGAGFSAAKQDRLVHPRCFGTMPKFISMALENNLMPIERAIQKITAIPAQKIGLERRGFIATDYFADIVIMDPGVSSSANHLNPFQYPKGIDYVFVNGKKALEKGALTEIRSGRTLKR